MSCLALCPRHSRAQVCFSDTLDAVLPCVIHDATCDFVKMTVFFFPVNIGPLAQLLRLLTTGDK